MEPDSPHGVLFYFSRQYYTKNLNLPTKGVIFIIIMGLAVFFRRCGRDAARLSGAGLKGGDIFLFASYMRIYFRISGGFCGNKV
ncbi:MAG: hypothetical protein J1E02_09010 [Coprobacter sp.]|nr:hypothetical protein [Coprobacter sp.]